MAEDRSRAEEPLEAVEGAVDPEAVIVDEATDEVMRLHLDKFEGPFEVLLYLIKAQEIDIFDIPIVTITDQYLRFLGILREENLEVAGDFLVMAATLIQIKSRMLLPIDLEEDEEEEVEEEDPRLELVEKLIEYRRYRDVAERLAFLEQERANWYTRRAKPPVMESDEEEEYLEVSLYDLIQAFRGVARFLAAKPAHTVEGRRFSVDEKVEWLLGMLHERESVAWSDMFRECDCREELVACFLAILECCRMGRIRAYQHRAFDEIRVFPVREGVPG